MVVIMGVKDERSREDIRFKLYAIGIKNRQILSGIEFIESNDAFKTKKYCLICGKYVDDFFPDGVQSELFKKNHIIGGGYNPKCRCPICGSIDRYRWIYYTLNMHTDILNSDKKVLWFAPEHQVLDRIKMRNPALSVYTADYVFGRAKYQTDMTRIQFESESFDYVIANHVLEHITDENKAVKELVRVTKPNGSIILSFPIATNKETIEDENITSDEDRLRVFGQIDHVRLYGWDYKERLEKYGIKIKTYSPNRELNTEMIMEYGLIPDDIIMFCKKESV